MAYNQAVLDKLLTDKFALERLKNGLETLYLRPVNAQDGEDAMSFLKRISGYQEINPVLSATALSSAA
ncbi:hypothetical protein [Nodosilinea nodulosa]|uniref:hypothetical protein n=1 Tax=Nodosilinea nodulosa TaxID=416001 RepID=UPI001CEC68DD|nr:hypothetical protein [Nodosilinea nodulosa]